MAMSGIEVDVECERAHDRQKKDKDVQWTVYKIADADDGSDDNEQQQQHQQCTKMKKGKGKKQKVRVEGCPHARAFSAKMANDTESAGGPPVTICREKMKELWREFISELPDDDGRYACFDYVTMAKSGAFTEKMRFVAWSPECASIKRKMIYSSTKDSLRKKLGVTKETFLASKNEDDVNTAFDDMMNDG